MSEQNYTEMLHALSKEYYYNHIAFSEYRERRKAILDEIDAEYNGTQAASLPVTEQDASLLSKAIGLFKANDAES